MDTDSGILSITIHLDLFILSCNQFLEDLTLTHSLLRSKISKDTEGWNQREDKNMKWWYRASIFPVSSSYISNRWHLLANTTDYQNMLATVEHYPGLEEPFIELSNNPAFVSANLAWPGPTTHSTVDQENTPIMPTYPCFIRLSKIPVCSFPSGTHDISSSGYQASSKVTRQCYSTNTPSVRRSLKLHLRPRESITRRYSIPFDSHTHGLNGISVADCVRLTLPLLTSSDNTSPLDLAELQIPKSNFDAYENEKDEINGTKVVYIEKAGDHPSHQMTNTDVFWS